ncbi:MAG TPA: urea amidolyase family protein [Streptosporangiaceae bacterium]|nr:urea amidolyase family protein [Streptosporangiaceae bacterium]
MITIKSAGDAALLLETGDAATGGQQGGNGAAGIAAAIRAAELPGVIDVVPGAVTVLVTFEPGSWSAPTLTDRLAVLAAGAAAPAAAASAAGEPVLIDTVYDGPDLASVAALTRLAEAEVITRHQAVEYRVGWLGFAPGFGYLTGLDPALAVPRLDSPRLSVPAGSVAIAGGLAAVYPSASPGGWRLLGRTAAVTWDPGREPPALLAPGQRVRFRAVERLPEEPTLRVTDLEHHVSDRWVEVVQPGPLTTVQDLGRPGLAHLGVPASGAADSGSLRLANALVGNDESEACLEVTLGRLALRFGFDAVVALTGAPAPIRITSAAHGGAAHSWDLPPQTAIGVPAGAILRLGAPPAGLRSYLAISGGIAVAPVLGSRSADVLSGLGPPPLRPGQRLPVGRPRSRPVYQPGRQPRGIPTTAALGFSPELRVIAGPRDDWFTPAALTALARGSYQVTTASNRSGLRLTGAPLRRAREGELPSEGMAAGSLQVSHDGQPILLLADHPTTGGYPVIGVVISADLGVAAQLRPGQHIRFDVRPGQPASSR